VREVFLTSGPWPLAPVFGGCSSVGRAPDLHSGGRRFDPDQLHHSELRFARDGETR
jgi:hypothetical protein